MAVSPGSGSKSSLLVYIWYEDSHMTGGLSGKK